MSNEAELLQIPIGAELKAALKLEASRYGMTLRSYILSILEDRAPVKPEVKQ